MKFQTLALAFVCLFSLTSLATPIASAGRPHLALMSPNEVHHLFVTRQTGLSTGSAVSITKDQQAVLDAGQRVYDWIVVLNKNRAAGQLPLSYSNPGNQGNPTIDKPKIYDATTGVDLFASILPDLPAAYSAVILSKDPLPTTSPIPEDQFLALGFRIIGAYDITARWLTMIPWLADMAKERVQDVRGYIFLGALADRDQKLKTFSSLSPDEKSQIRAWLEGMCLNGQTEDTLDRRACQRQVLQAETAAKLPAFYAAKLAGSKKVYDDRFTLEPYYVRKDIVWTSKDPATIHYPFLTIADASVASYFKDNVEDEWKGTGWHLSIDFTTSSDPDLSHLEYEPHTTPHADTNKIVMDEYEPRTEYLSQWTIRHEFGHLLGFKDCYVEFYDEDIKKIVNYPLDPTNLMCSRRGHLQPQHFDVLKVQYYKP